MLKQRFYLFGALAILLLLLLGCANTSASKEKEQKNPETEKKEPVDHQEKSDEVDSAGLIERETEVKDFPEWLPQPREFIVLLDMDGGPMRSVVLETGESDLPAMVARFNEELAAVGAGGILVEDGDANFYTASGEIDYGDELVLLTIGEYESGGALVEGNTGSVSYSLFNFE